MSKHTEIIAARKAMEAFIGPLDPPAMRVLFALRTCATNPHLTSVAKTPLGDAIAALERARAAAGS